MLNKLFAFIFSSLTLLAFVAPAQKEITLEDIWLKNTFKVAAIPGFDMMRDNKTYVIQEGGDILLYDLQSNKLKKKIFEQKSHQFENEMLVVNSFAFSKDEKKMLLFTEEESIYRRSVLKRTYVFDTDRKKVALLVPEKVLHASFSPDGSKVAFVRDNNLFIKDLASGQITAVTTDGEKNKIINGNCDWVYEEEFEFTQAYQWSPKGNYLAYYKFDESAVKEFTIPFYEGAAYPRNYTYKYPKAGEDNSKVSIHIYNLAAKKSATADVGSNTDQYIPRIKWTNNDQELCIYQLNRLQNHLTLLLSNAQTGQSQKIFEEENKYYIEINDNLTFLDNNSSFIFNSERTGFNHLYEWNWKNKQLKPITQGNFEVTQLVAIDQVNKKIYYLAADNPLQRTLYSYDLKTGLRKQLTTQKGFHDVEAKGTNFFIDKFSTVNTPPVYSLINHEGKVIRILEKNEGIGKKIKDYAFAPIEFVQIPNDNGAMLNAYMIKPKNFDPKTKYPVLMYQYSGPGSQQVMDNFPRDNYWWHQMLAQKGYLIVVADGTGTGARGEDFKKKTYLQLGKLESDDQIAVAKYLAKQNYVDANRIGIWGWSYGGFMSSICILKAPEVFKTAIAVAPVTNWRFYDNIYTERYMRTPAENQTGYDENAPVSMASRLKGNYLLIHGTADDNVHFQNAAELTKKLIEANKQFESLYYPNKHHGISGGKTRYQLYKKMTDYLLDHL